MIKHLLAIDWVQFAKANVHTLANPFLSTHSRLSKIQNQMPKKNRVKMKRRKEKECAARESNPGRKNGNLA